MKALADEMAELLEYVGSWTDRTDVVLQAAWLAKKYRKEQKYYAEDTYRIEINFPKKVYVADSKFQSLVEIVTAICNEYESKNPGRVMWAAGMGSKITYMPMTREEELAGKHMEFADDTLAIDCCEREDYDWPCKKCAHTQGDHKECITDPPAGNCDFEPADSKPSRKKAPSHESTED
jgi:hypothetical protein